MPPSFAGVDYDTARQLFLTGRAAMLIGGSFDIAAYKALNPTSTWISSRRLPPRPAIRPRLRSIL